MGPRRAVLPTAADFWGATFNESSSPVKNSPPSTVTITEITEEEETAPPPVHAEEVRSEVRENVEQRLQPVATVKPMSIVTHFNRLSYASTDDSGRSSQLSSFSSSASQQSLPEQSLPENLPVPEPEPDYDLEPAGDSSTHIPTPKEDYNGAENFHGASNFNGPQPFHRADTFHGASNFHGAQQFHGTDNFAGNVTVHGAGNFHGADRIALPTSNPPPAPPLPPPTIRGVRRYEKKKNQWRHGANSNNNTLRAKDANGAPPLGFGGPTTIFIDKF
ncbi:hypothetical protein AAVH_23929 [Aphelenchoides avenae]|nr:hypothetical protein AAVH_23929 [Aphelenchus avenae]